MPNTGQKVSIQAGKAPCVPGEVLYFSCIHLVPLGSLETSNLQKWMMVRELRLKFKVTE